MCMCCDFAIYVNKFFFAADLTKGLWYMFISGCLTLIIELILTCLGCILYIEEDDKLSVILFSCAVVTCFYTTLWHYIIYRWTKADLLLVAEYAVLSVPLPCCSVFGYTVITGEMFFIISGVIQLLITILNLYYSVVIHSVYIEQLYKDKEAAEAAGA